MPSRRAPEPVVDHRCACGRLVARLTERGVEIKCSRCKRVVPIEWERGEALIHAPAAE